MAESKGSLAGENSRFIVRCRDDTGYIYSSRDDSKCGYNHAIGDMCL